jgi:hypothetical protein
MILLPKLTTLIAPIYLRGRTRARAKLLRWVTHVSSRYYIVGEADLQAATRTCPSHDSRSTRGGTRSDANLMHKYGRPRTHSPPPAPSACLSHSLCVHVRARAPVRRRKRVARHRRLSKSTVRTFSGIALRLRVNSQVSAGTV